MLTAADGRTDGQFIKYWEQPQRWRKHDPDLFDQLSRCKADPLLRDVAHADTWGILPGATYYAALLPDSAPARRSYFSDAWKALAGCDLLFFDPDNGLEVPSVPYGRRDSSKYLYWSEVEEAFGQGCSLLIYQHFQRKQRIEFIKGLGSELSQRTGAATVYSFSTPHVVFFLAVQSKHAPLFEATERCITERWEKQVRPLQHVVV